MYSRASCPGLWPQQGAPFGCRVAAQSRPNPQKTGSSAESVGKNGLWVRLSATFGRFGQLHRHRSVWQALAASSRGRTRARRRCLGDLMGLQVGRRACRGWQLDDKRSKSPIVWENVGTLQRVGLLLQIHRVGPGLPTLPGQPRVLGRGKSGMCMRIACVRT